MSDYKKSLNLPDTSFPMKANLTQREPEMLRWWEENNIYGTMLEASGSRGSFRLHDGPPYANGHLHLGHALNKILKDITIKSRNIQGQQSVYVPGWDCHGLPIELKVEHELGEKKKEMPPYAVRRRCRQYADKFIDIQRKEFKRLGVLGDWDHPYKTMLPEYESATATELANFVEKGNVVRSKKPIYWCCSCQTALAEAEVEYADHKSPSIYVRFPLTDDRLKTVFENADPSRAYVIIWTTTPWTLPSNMAVALHPEFEYSLVEYDGSQYVLATELVESVAKACGWDMGGVKAVGTATGQQLELVKARHPFYDRESPLILGGHVTLDAGTGCVHTAPGHGREDYEVCLQYGIDIYSPLNDRGEYLDSVEFFAGLQVQKANPNVIEKVKEVGNLMGQADITHSYPHCWRCKKPVIFRATTQWFVSMEANELRQKALKAIRNDVEWIPSWGEERIYNMIEQRPDWCISRQRLWGVPILALLCEDCGEAWNDPEWMRDIAARFAKHPTGCDYWYEADMKDIVPEGLKCPKCGGQHWKRESDILDVWFDSGTSFAAVLEKRPELGFPADLYLEGSDQHRGWFNSSLLTSVAVNGYAPYKSVLTHGFTVDGEGRKMSKSVGNTVAPQEVIEKYGADVLRLWVSSADYQGDIRLSPKILKQLSDVYRKIRNTFRYLLGNLADFDPAKDMIAYQDMTDLDKWALLRLEQVFEEVTDAYENYQFHVMYHAIHNFCTVDLSAMYLDVIKDRLYTEKADSQIRRSAQSAMYVILDTLVKIVAPVLSFTAEEVWQNMPAVEGKEESVLLTDWPKAHKEYLDADLDARWAQFLSYRRDLTRVLEGARKEHKIGHALDAAVTIYADGEDYDFLSQWQDQLATLLIVSEAKLVKGEAPADAVAGEDHADMKVVVAPSTAEKCERCWIHSDTVGSDPNHPTLCARCAAVLSE